VVVELPAVVLAHSTPVPLFSESTIEASGIHLLGRTDCKKVAEIPLFSVNLFIAATAFALVLIKSKTLVILSGVTHGLFVSRVVEEPVLSVAEGTPKPSAPPQPLEPFSHKLPSS
jgi:hypothetical protein